MSYVALGKLLNFSVPQFPLVLNDTNYTIYLTELLWRLIMMNEQVSLDWCILLEEQGIFVQEKELVLWSYPTNAVKGTDNYGILNCVF